jgi:cytochrome c-type biogenesis protein CcmF
VISTLGYGLILGALACAAFGAALGIGGGMARRSAQFPWLMRAAIGFFACMLSANLLMVIALLTHDFSVKYVAQVGSRATPIIYTVVSLWSALEGSILFWGAIMATYVLAFALIYRRAHVRYMSLALGVMLAVGVFFAFLIAGPANPWTHLTPAPPDGPGPNPLLQNHILMVIHPPMLYCGYVGMVVPFGIAAAALLRGELSEAWTASLRRWTLVPWTFLSVGIILGSWWAYAVLGWGGYWAWDPVENASFLPWLTATAFIHSTMVQERRKMLKLWTLSLALGTFLLTILGTFMTRSGIFNSVHSFTQSDIGPTFLVFIAILLVFSIVLLTVRGHLLIAEGAIQSPWSREAAILVNNLLFVGLTFTVLLGTLFPLVTEAIKGVKISVGEPYFNKMAVPGAIAILFLMGVGPVLPWGEANRRIVSRQLLLPTLAGVAVVVVCLFFGLRGFLPLLTFGLAGFVAAINLRELFLPAKVRMTEHGENPWTALVRSASRARRRFGGYVVHLGIVLILVAVAASSSYVTHVGGTISVGKALRIGDYEAKLVGFDQGSEPHRKWIAATLELSGAGMAPQLLRPRMNFFERSTDPIGTPAVRSTALGDVYFSLLALSEDNRTATLNAWIFPMVGWIWWSIPILVLGSLIAIWPGKRSKLVASVPSGVEGPLVPSGVEGAEASDLNRGAA